MCRDHMMTDLPNQHHMTYVHTAVFGFTRQFVPGIRYTPTNQSSTRGKEARPPPHTQTSSRSIGERVSQRAAGRQLLFAASTRYLIRVSLFGRQTRSCGMVDRTSVHVLRENTMGMLPAASTKQHARGKGARLLVANTQQPRHPANDEENPTKTTSSCFTLLAPRSVDRQTGRRVVVRMDHDRPKAKNILVAA